MKFLDKIFVRSTDNTLIQFFRYLFVGGLAFVVDFGLLYVLTEFCGLHYLLSATISFTAGLMINYLISMVWIFQSSGYNKLVEFLTFAAIGIVGLLLTNLLMWVFTDHVGVHYMISKMLTTAIVLSWNFFARKYILFSKKGDK